MQGDGILVVADDQVPDVRAADEESGERYRSRYRQQRDDGAGAEGADAYGDDRSNAGLQAAQQGRGAARVAGEWRQSQGRGVRIGEADAGKEDEKEKQRGFEANEMSVNPGEERESDEDLCR